MKNATTRSAPVTALSPRRSRSPTSAARRCSSANTSTWSSGGPRWLVRALGLQREREFADSDLVDRVEIPINAETGRIGRNGMAITDRQAGVGDGIELRDVLDPAAVGHRAAERHVQLHQEVRADRDIERLGHVDDLQPRGDAADSGRVDLYDRAAAPLQIFTEG